MSDQAIRSFIRKKLTDFKAVKNEKMDIKISEYHRALSDTLIILEGSSDLAKLKKVKILAWMEDYACVILVVSGCLDPCRGNIYLIGLDGWTFTVTDGTHSALASDDVAVVCAGSIPQDKTNDLILLLKDRIKKLCHKKGDDRSAANLDGGHQKTPGFILANCVRILNEINKTQVDPQNSGFTDVSKHTGCEKRDTQYPLSVSLVKFILKFGIEARAADAEEYFVRFMTEYYLNCATELAKGSNSNHSANQAMEYLQKGFKYGVMLVDSHFWPDEDKVSTEFVSIRKILEDRLTDKAASNADKYNVYIPDLKEMENMRSPKIFLEEMPQSDPNHGEGENEILRKSKENLEWIPSYELKNLKDCIVLLDDESFGASKPYQFSIVLVQIEQFLYGLADLYLKDDCASDCHIQFCFENLISVVEKLSQKIKSFASTQKLFLDVELKSRSALLKWLEFCLLFQMSRQQYKVLSEFSPALDYRDLEHLVLRSKTAWDCMDVICGYLERRTRKELTRVFSGRNNEVDGTLRFADAFVADDQNSETFDRLLEKEKLDGQSRIDERWEIIQQKKKECESIRHSISEWEKDLCSVNEELLCTQKYSNEYYRYLNPNWKSLTQRGANYEKYISDARRLHGTTKKAPPYIRQPLSNRDDHGKRALFFCVMPPLLRALWKSSYESQRQIFHTSKNGFSSVNCIDFHSYYEGPYPFRRSRSVIKTPIALFCRKPPKDFGNDDVEQITSVDDGVWYATNFEPTFVWENGNPFIIGRAEAVDRFTEKIINEELQWAVKQLGRDTPADRGNWALSKLNEKPDHFTREQYLNFGDLRAFPLLQINNVLNSIKNMSLPFKLAETHQLVQLVLYHIGEVSYSNGIRKIWKKGIYNDQFMECMKKSLQVWIDRLRDAPKNHEEFLLMLEILVFMSQFYPKYFVPLSEECSIIACTWANNLDDEMIQAVNDDSSSNAYENIRAKKHIFLLYAALAYEMTPSLNADQVKQMLCLIVRINATISESDKISEKLTSTGQKLIGRVHFMLARLFHLRDFESSHLSEAAKYIFPGRVENHMEWKRLDGVYCFYTKNHEGYHISINVMNGVVLLNGTPPGRLPFGIVNHPLYVSVFGSNLNFSTELLEDGTQKTINASKNRYYSFKTTRDHLVVHEEEYSKGQVFRLRLLDPSKIENWGAQLPLGLKQLYSHWQSDDLNLVVLRPNHFMKREVFYIYVQEKLLLVPKDDRNLGLSDLIQRIGSYERMIHFDDPLKTLALNVWQKFDQKEFIHIYLTAKKSLKIVFVRYHLSFELRGGCPYFISLQQKGFRVSSCQLMTEILYGFDNYILLESDETKRLIIVPNHTIHQKNQKLILKRDPKQFYDILSPSVYLFNAFKQHHRLHEIEAVNISARLQLASLFAGTSTLVPEKWIGMTGFEMSIHLLRKCWVNRPLSLEEFGMLKSILELTSLPPALVIIANSLLENSKKVSFLHSNTQKDTHVHILNDNQYVCSLNQYFSSSSRLGSLSSVRSELTEEECISIGIIYQPIFDNNLKQSSKKPKYTSIDIHSMERKMFQLTSSDWTSTDKSHLDDEAIEKTGFNNLPFTVPKESPLFSTEIGYHMISQLQRSYHIHQKNIRTNLLGSSKQILRKLRKMINNTSSLRLKLEKRIIADSDLDSKKDDQNHNRFAIFWAANGLSNLTLSDMVRLSWMSNSMKCFNPMLTENDFELIKMMVIDWMQLCVLEDRICRAISLLKQGKLEETIRELQTYRKYDILDHPQWLAFEVDQGIQIRPEQVDIIQQILSNNGSVAQLNMGLGKTRVILPCLFLELSRPNSCYQRDRNIVSIYLLSSLLNEGFTYFHRVLTAGVLNKKLFLMPFNRDVVITESNAKILVANYQYCRMVGGAIIQAPEHRLSLYLKSFTFDNTANLISNVEENAAHILRKVDSLPFVHIYDEVDEIMNPFKQLVYAEGSAELLHAGHRRWEAIFALLFNLRHHVLVKEYFQNKEISSRLEVTTQEYDMFQLLPCQALEEALSEFTLVLAKSLFMPTAISEKNLLLEFPIDWMRKLNSDDLKGRIIKFITNVKDPVMLEESDFESIDHYNDLLVLRGLLGHGVLAHCLMLRHNVNYGVVDDHKTPMAIPFRAANLPALRSEFAQPDCAIGFTVLSYYNRGLDRKQFRTALSFLLQLGQNYRKYIYGQIYNLYAISQGKETSVNAVEKVDLTNILQFNLLYRMYRKSMPLINFWLSNVVFPTHTMIFPQKLTANSWDLTDKRKSVIQCGFSGTVDSCVFMPYPLKLQKLSNPSLAGTDGKMISHLVCNAKFSSIKDIDSKDDDVVNQMVKLALNEDLDALIDAGALLCSYSNKDIALHFLHALNGRRFKGVVFFCTGSNIWKIIDQRHILEPLESSSIHESEAFVIYDQSRCRGADMKLNSNAKALLTIGPKLRKEDLMQAAGRLRKLDYGQKIIVTTTRDVEIMLRDTISLSPLQSIEMQHVLLYTLFNSIKSVEESLGYYVNQGIHFLKTAENDKGPRNDETTALREVYLGRIVTKSLAEMATGLLADILDLNSENQKFVTNTIRKYANQYGEDLVHGFCTFTAQVERELETERELVREQEIALPVTVPAKEKDWDYQVLLNHPAPEVMQVGEPISILDFLKTHIGFAAVQNINWGCEDIFLTRNFALPLAESKKLDDYLRPVRHGLYFPVTQKVLLISDREADFIADVYCRNLSVSSQSPIMFNVNSLKNGYDISSSFIYSTLIAKFSQLPDKLHTLIELISGETDLSHLAQTNLHEIIETSIAVDGAKFFVEKRGFRILFEGSSLKKKMEEINSRLFWLLSKPKIINCQNHRS